MELSVSHQLIVVVCMFLCGALAGVIFDLFRGFRRCVKSGNGIIVMQDLVLWFAELVIVYYTAFKVNNAKIRGYEAVALICGAVIYFLTLSEYTVKITCKLTSFVLKILSAVLFPVNKTVAFISKQLKIIGIWAKKKAFFAQNKVKEFIAGIRNKPLIKKQKK